MMPSARPATAAPRRCRRQRLRTSVTFSGAASFNASALTESGAACVGAVAPSAKAPPSESAAATPMASDFFLTVLMVDSSSFGPGRNAQN
jgi:hypothetical protein